MGKTAKQKAFSVFLSNAAFKETKPQNLGRFGSYGKGIGVNIAHNFLQGCHLSTANYANQHCVRNLRIHTRCGQGGNAAAQFVHNRVCHFFGFIGNDTEFNGGLESV